MKTKFILFLTFLFSTFTSVAQNSAVTNDFISINKKKTEVFTNDKGELRISVSKKDGKKILENGFVDYETFGAKGDGKTDDIDAIAAAHLYANQLNLPVKTKAEAIYYISGKNRIAEIRTNTDFGTSQFIIDDRNVEKINEPVFLVGSMQQAVKLKGITSLKRNQAKIDVTFASTNVISVTSNKVKRYIRLGSNQNSGAAQTDVFIVDKNGNVDKNTPIIWDFDEISSITALPIDETILTLKGGKFQTISNAEGKKNKLLLTWHFCKTLQCSGGWAAAYNYQRR